MQTADRLGEELYRKARIDTREPHAGGAIELAKRILGPGAIALGDSTALEGRRIILERGMPAPLAHYAVGRELGRMRLLEELWFRRLGDAGQTRAAGQLGAWLVAPTPAFIDVVAEVGEDLRELAGAFCVTQAVAALRLSETAATRSIASVSGVRRRVVSSRHR